MSRRNENPFSLFWELFQVIPVWAGPVLVGILFAVLEWLVPALLDRPVEFKPDGPRASAQHGVDILLVGLAKASRKLAPLVAFLLLGMWFAATVKRRVEDRKSTRH